MTLLPDTECLGEEESEETLTVEEAAVPADLLPNSEGGGRGVTLSQAVRESWERRTLFISVEVCEKLEVGKESLDEFVLGEVTPRTVARLGSAFRGSAGSGLDGPGVVVKAGVTIVVVTAEEDA